MPSEPVPAEQPDFVGSDEDVDLVIDLCDGDARAAVRALIVTNSALREDCARLRREISAGYVRGRGLGDA